MKTCIKCYEAKDAEEFSWKIKDVKRGNTCKRCHSEYRKLHYKNNRQKYIDKARKWERENGGRIWVKYGLTQDEHAVLFNRFEGKCWLCRTREAKVVDHDHGTQQVRGALCHGCNTGLGALGDSIVGLERGILYLQNVA